MIKRLDVLGAAKYVHQAYKGVPANMVPFVLMKTFGNANIFIAKVVSGKKFTAIGIHGIWQNSHSFSNKDYERAVKMAKRIQKKYANRVTTIYFSPFLEHREPKTKMTKLFKDIKKVAPDLVLVNSYITGGGQVKNALNEIHHMNPIGKPYIYSTDGTDAINIDITRDKNKHNKAFMFGLWTPMFNLKRTLDDKTPPKKRKFIPNVKFIRAVAFLFNDRGTDTLPSSWIYKPFAELTTPSSKRNNTPLFLAPVNKSKLTVKDITGKKIADFVSYGRYHDTNLYVYRHLDSMGFQLAKKAYKRTGSYTCTVEGYKLNLGFRGGRYK